MKLVFKSLLVIAILGVIAAVAALVYLGYDQTVYLAAKVTGSLYRLEKVKGLFSPKAFKAMIALFAVVILGLGVLFRYADTIYSLFVRFVTRTGAALRSRYRNDWSDPVFLCIILIPVAASIYYALRLPVQWDEAYTYVKFTSRSIFSCISYYPAPNNHILFSVLTNIFLHLPLPDLICMRIPAILINILGLLFLFSFIKEYYNKYVAYITVALFSGFFLTFFYSYMSRGYGLQCLCFILMSHSIFKILQQRGNKLYWTFYCIACITGFYTMPSYLYAFVMGNLFILVMLGRPTRYYFVTSTVVVIVTIFLYTPIIVFNGYNALANNEFVIHISRSEVIRQFPTFFYQTFRKITFLPQSVPYTDAVTVHVDPIAVCLILIIVGIGGFFMFRKYAGAPRLYFPFILILTPALLVIHGVIPYERTFEYYSVIYALFGGIIFYAVLGRYATTIVCLVTAILMQGLLTYKFNCDIIPHELPALEAAKAIPYMRSGKNFEVHTTLFDLFLLFDLRRRKVEEYDLKFVRVEPTNMDTVIGSHKADFYSIDTDSDRTIIAKPVYKGPYETIYKR